MMKPKLGEPSVDPGVTPSLMARSIIGVLPQCFNGALNQRRGKRYFGRSTRESAGITPRPKLWWPKHSVMAFIGSVPEPMLKNWCGNAEVVNYMPSRYMSRRPT